MTEITSKSLYQALWNSADVLRGQMNADEYKNYLLGLVFYKYLSDRMLLKVVDLLEETTESLDEAQAIFEKAYNDLSLRPDLIAGVKEHVSYVIEPHLTFTKLVNDVYSNRFDLMNLQQGFRDIEQQGDFENLFEDIDLYSKKLGATPQKQNKCISDVMKEINMIDIAHHGDILGDAYEFLIGQFASESGKKAGEFYTPQAVSTLMTRIIMKGNEDVKGFSLYDPTCGSGSLLLNAKKYSHVANTLRYFGQEKNTSTFNLARMNMILHGVDINNQHLNNADTLDADWPTDEPTNFDAVVMNPPYSANWNATVGFLEDPRFYSYGVLAPKSKADFAFLLHGFYHLKDTGTMAIVLPHGVLFRGGTEGKIRKNLLENGYIDAVIGLPANIFFNTSIPTIVIVLKKKRSTRDVFFIDASNEFTKVKKQNLLEPVHIDKIVNTYFDRKEINRYAQVVPFDEIQKNDFNLNIPRYVDTFEEEEPIDIKAVSSELRALEMDIEGVENEILTLLNELQETEDVKDLLDAAKAVFS